MNFTPAPSQRTISPQKGKICMKGRVYSRERCRCGGIFRDNGFTACVCKDCGTRAAGKFYVEFRVNKKEKIKRHFDTYEESARYLTYLRHQTDIGKFDLREHQKDRPLSFRKLALQWLQSKEGQIKPTSLRNHFNTMKRAIKIWGDRAITEIGFAEIEDFLLSQGREDGGTLSEKSRANMRSSLHAFWTWLRRRQVLRADQVPEIPHVAFKLGFRRIVDKGTQGAIIDEIGRLSASRNPKILLAVEWLARYIAIRPGELLEVREKDIDLARGYLFIPHPKEGRPKWVPMTEDDVERARLLKEAYQGFAEQHFFRSCKGEEGVAPDVPFNLKRLYKWWKKACANVGVEGVDLYGGTRHSSATALRHDFTPEQIKRATMHSTNQAFERYYQTDGEELRKIYAAVQTGNAVPFRKAEEGREFGAPLGLPFEGKSGRGKGSKSLESKKSDRSKMAGPTGLEPAPSGLTGQRYNHLNYGPASKNNPSWWAVQGSNL